jgi:hypothetical protein
MDITVRLSENVVRRDSSGAFQTHIIGLELTEKDIPQDKVRETTLALRFQVKKFIVNTKFLDGLITADQGLEELAKYAESLNAK